MNPYNAEGVGIRAVRREESEDAAGKLGLA